MAMSKETRKQCMRCANLDDNMKCEVFTGHQTNCNALLDTADKINKLYDDIIGYSELEHNGEMSRRRQMLLDRLDKSVKIK